MYADPPISGSHYDAIVVGSGFGGSVMAYRLAEAGRRVCVLERGKAYPPGSFPRSPYRMARNFWDPTQGLYGLFDYWSFSGLNALVSSGLGGGSLIYANVLLRKDERWFADDGTADGVSEHWPLGRAELDPHYDRVERMLAARPYPFDRPPYDRTQKTIAFREAAERTGREWFLPNLAVAFGNDGDEPRPGAPLREEHPNLHGVPRYSCRLTGECDFGCNEGAKNTLDLTYLSAAERLGAEIHTRCEVRVIEPRDGGGYSVGLIHHAAEHEDRPIDLFDPAQVRHRVSGDRLVLAAGTLGTVRLLLRNRSAFPHISRRLGSRFCGNGDLLTFAVRPTREAGGRRIPRVIDPSYGPVITIATRVADRADGGEGRGFYLEDAGFPDWMAWMLQLLDTPRNLWRLRPEVARLARERLRRDSYRHTGRSAVLSGLLGTAELSGGVLPLLAMGRDVPDGRMYLRHNHLQVDWRKGRPGRLRGSGGRSGAYFDSVRESSRELAAALGARFVDDPIWFLGRVITVHPLGGCPMGRHAGEGVVDPGGEVFGYPGLTIADGSTLPGPVGANPSLTIAALADAYADAALGEA